VSTRGGGSAAAAGEETGGTAAAAGEETCPHPHVSTRHRTSTSPAVTGKEGHRPLTYEPTRIGGSETAVKGERGDRRHTHEHTRSFAAAPREDYNRSPLHWSAKERTVEESDQTQLSAGPELTPMQRDFSAAQRMRQASELARRPATSPDILYAPHLASPSAPPVYLSPVVQ